MAARVTNGHRAAVCGLVIAGVALTEACKVAGVPYLAMLAVLPDRWHTRVPRPYRWRGHELEELYESWMDPYQRAETIANRFGISPTRLRQIARKNDWPQRSSKIRRFRRRPVRPVNGPHAAVLQ